MEIEFEQNRDFNQSHEEEGQNNYRDKGKPQGREGDPNQRLVKREELDNDKKELDRRPADIENERLDDDSGHASAIPGIQSDNQNSTRNNSKPIGEDPNHNAEIENKEVAEQDGNE